MWISFTFPCWERSSVACIKTWLFYLVYGASGESAAGKPPLVRDGGCDAPRGPNLTSTSAGSYYYTSLVINKVLESEVVDVGVMPCSLVSGEACRQAWQPWLAAGLLPRAPGIRPHMSSVCLLLRAVNPSRITSSLWPSEMFVVRHKIWQAIM